MIQGRKKDEMSAPLNIQLSTHIRSHGMQVFHSPLDAKGEKLFKSSS